MTHEEHQAKLLDNYLSALQDDSNADVPDGLDPEMAGFARMFYVGQSASEETSTAKSRVWQQVVLADSTQLADTPQSQSKNHAYQEMEPYMIQLREKQKRSANPYSGFMPLAATAIIAIVVTLGLVWVLFRNDGNSLQGSPVTIVTETPNPAILIVTATPLPTTIIPLEPTMLPTVPPPDSPDAVVTIEQPVRFVTDAPIPTSTPLGIAPFDATATELISEATRMAAPATQDATIRCQVDAVLSMSINQSQIGPDDTLVISGAAVNWQSDSIYLEIFGGTLTDNQFEQIAIIDSPSSIEDVLAYVDGEDYANGSYLIQMQVLDANGAIISSCALPVTFSD